MTTVKELLQMKSPSVWTIHPEATVFQALQLLAEKDIGALPVVAQEKVVGIFSERDYARKGILKGRTSRDTCVREMMTPAVYYSTPEMTLEECMAIMTEKRIRHLPVLDGERLIGIVTLGDIVKQIIAEHKIVIAALEKYITGGSY